MDPSQSESQFDLRSSMNKSAIDDPSSPYLLHHSDSLRLVLVSQQLIEDNYASWSHDMSIALLTKNKIGFIDGTITKPESTNADLLIHGLEIITLSFRGSCTPFEGHFCECHLCDFCI